MRNVALFALVAAVVTLPLTAMAGSTITKSKIINKAKINKSANIAVGSRSVANMGTIKIKGSKVSKSKIINKAKVNKSANIAVGSRSEANMGSIVIE